MNSLPGCPQTVLKIPWEACHSRVTIFPIEPGQYDPKWFEIIAGGPPAREVTQRDIQLHQATGPFEDGLLELTAQADRVHFKYVPQESAEVVVATLGPPSTVAAALTGRIRRLLAGDNPVGVRRVAVGIVAVVRVHTHQEAYGHLARLLPSVQVDAEGSADFLYQINRPRQTDLDGLTMKVNRLSRWSAATVVRVSVTAPATLPVKTTQHAQQETVVQADIDVNSDADRTDQIPPQWCGALVESFCKSALEILDKGDLA